MGGKLDPYAVNGRKTYTKRYASVNATTGQAVSFADVAIKGATIHIEGATVVAHFVGSHNADDTGAGTAYLTSNGTSITVDIGAYAGETIYTIIAPADTINVSVFAWA